MQITSSGTISQPFYRWVNYDLDGILQMLNVTQRINFHSVQNVVRKVFVSDGFKHISKKKWSNTCSHVENKTEVNF